MNSLSLRDILDSQAIGISITGMSIVFTGLILLSIYITVLPKILEFLEKPRPDKKEEATADEAEKPEKTGTVATAETETPIAPVDEEANDIASVIGLVLQLEHERAISTENEQITISSNIGEPSPWSRAGRMRKMPQRRTHAKI